MYRGILKLIITALLLTLIFEPIIYGQNWNSIIYDKYFSSSHQLLLKSNIQKIKTSIEHTDTLEGYEIHYFAYYKNRAHRCKSFVFFVEGHNIEPLLETDIYAFMKNNLVSLVNYSLPALQASQYEREETQNFVHRSYVHHFKKSELPIVDHNYLHRISKNEYIRVYKVRVVAHAVYGSDQLFSFFNPLQKRSIINESVLLQYEYSEVIERCPIFVRRIFGSKLKYYSKFDRCEFNIH